MSDAPRQLPPKKEVALALLEGPSMYVHLDPRQAGVVVPKWLSNQPQLVLQVGLNMAIPIPDLKVEDEGITCTLSFSRSPFWCRLPWNAIYALVGEDGRGMVWPDDVPPEVALQAQNQKNAQPSGKPAKKGRKLAAVDATDDARRASRARDGAGEPDAQPDAFDEARRGPTPVPQPARETAGSPRAGSGKPRRELPPYLRIIK